MSNAMREILFRGKRVDNGKWVKGFLSKTSTRFKYCIEYIGHGIMMYSEVIPETVGQFTSLTDKNGNKIFEGDIIDHNGEHYVIKYLEKYMRFSPTNHRAVFAVFDYTQSEIIGNIHDGGVGRD